MGDSQKFIYQPPDKEKISMKKKLTSIVLTLTIVFTVLFASASPAEAKTPSRYIWSEKVAPNYVVSVGKAKVSNKPAKGKIKYSKLDKYGRTRRVVGNITFKMVEDSAGWREEFADGCDPSGWGTNKIVKIKLYTGDYYKGYFWNRSHLIADSLGGRAIKRNLITGTRMQNVGANDGLGGMAYTERKVVSYLYKHHNVSVYYSACPIYKDKELLPRSVVVDVRSSDNVLNERVIVYNAAKGYKINYKKGTFKKNSGNAVVAAAAATSTTVYTTKTGKRYHLDRDCSGLSNASKIYKSTKAAAKKKGLTLCKICG